MVLLRASQYIRATEPVRTVAKDDPAFAANALMTPALMTPAQITRGICFRRYAFGKPVQQIADETGLRYAQVLSVLKGEPFSVAVAARLTGYLRTRCPPSQLERDRTRGGVMSEKRRGLFRRLSRMKAIARVLKQDWRFRPTHKLFGFTDDMVRAYVYNAEDAVKEAIVKLYPTICAIWKLSDDMAPWEYLERIDSLKADPKARDAIARYQSAARQENAGTGVKAA